MGDLICDVWPPDALEQATLMARSLLEATGGDRTASRAQLVTLIEAIAMPGAEARDVTGLADQVLDQPDIAALVTQTRPRVAPERSGSGRTGRNPPTPTPSPTVYPPRPARTPPRFPATRTSSAVRVSAPTTVTLTALELINSDSPGVDRRDRVTDGARRSEGSPNWPGRMSDQTGRAALIEALGGRQNILSVLPGGRIRVRSAARASEALKLPGVRSEADPEGPRRDSLFIWNLKVGPTGLSGRWLEYQARPWRRRRRGGLKPEDLRMVQAGAGRLLQLLGGPGNVIDVWAAKRHDLVLLAVRDVRLIRASSKSGSESVIRDLKAIRDQSARQQQQRVPAPQALVEVAVPRGLAGDIADELGWSAECSRAARSRG